jgi:hypothetical protein
VPEAKTIETIIDAAFWASLRREEGVTPTISMAYAPPHPARQPLLFHAPLPLYPASLAKLAPAVERPGIHLGVWSEGGELAVWGTTRRLPAYCFVVEVVASGLLVIKDRTEPYGKFRNVAVLEGDVTKFVDERNASPTEYPPVVRSLVGLEGRGPDALAANVLVQLAASMRAHGRGGALLIVPSDTVAWQESLVSPILYAVHPPFAGLANLLSPAVEETDTHEWQEELRRAVDAMAGLTAVDGAMLTTDRYELLAFGAKIARRRGRPPVERVLVTEPIEGSEKTLFAPTQLGGTRHLSAAQFVQDQRDAVAVVASQDGRCTAFAWSTSEDVVHAHRVEALLL